MASWHIVAVKVNDLVIWRAMASLTYFTSVGSYSARRPDYGLSFSLRLAAGSVISVYFSR